MKSYYELNEDKLEVINIEECEDIEGPFNLFLNCKETTDLLDLKKEVVLTMLHSLEKLGNGRSFFRLESMLPASIGVRFHKRAPEDLAETNPLIREILKIGTNHQGVYRCSLAMLAYNLKMNPFTIPKMLYSL